MILAWWTLPGLALASLPALLTLANLRFFTRAPRPAPGARPAGVSVLVPARDEARVIGRLAAAVLANRDVDLELVILDDDSQDETAAIVSALAVTDPRVRLLRGQPLPPGWCGKQHACWQLAQAARHDLLVFLDADVTLEPDALARTVAFLETRGVDLASGFPHQETGCLLDWLLLPLIHFVLLGYLPLAIARIDNRPGLAAGCGQLFITRREAYRACGGHAAIKASLHDGIKLPRAYRAAGLSSDLFDAGDIARCRMYGTDREVLRGLGKNATEGIAAPGSILPFTLLLAGGQILPALLLGSGLATGWEGWPTWGVAMALAAAAAAWAPRLLAVHRFGHSLTSALVHPLGVAVFLGIQWTALIRRSLGLKTSWRGRALSPQ
ncbi:MAG: glycosyltransferase family A protein [Planctomycetia bacterium]